MDNSISNTQNINKNRKLTTKNGNLTLSLNDVRNLAILKYGSVTNFGKNMGITHGMASQLLTGKYLPLKSDTIRRVAECLGIDAIQLTQIYLENKNKGEILNG